MTRLVKWLIATEVQFPLIVSTHKGRGGLQLQQKLNFKTFYKFWKFQILHLHFSNSNRFFFSERDLTAPCTTVSALGLPGRSCLIVVQNAS
jgi:hypothetical protein